MNSNNNYSDILRLRSHEFYSNVLNSNDLRQLSSQTPTTTQTTTANNSTTTPTTLTTTADRLNSSHNWIQMNRDFEPILRSNSSLSLDQKRNNNSFLTSNSIDFKDFRELRECRFGSDRTTQSTTASTTSTAKTSPEKTFVAKKSRTIGSIKSLSISNENLSKIHPKSHSKASKTKSLFFKNKNIESNTETSKVDLMSEDTERRRRLRQLFIHYDIQSALSLDELFVDDNDNSQTTTAQTPTTTDDSSVNSSEEEFENEFNSNSLLGFCVNFRNEIGKELVYCLQLNQENSETQSNDDNSRRQQQKTTTRRPTHTPALARQLSCLSSFDMSSDPSQSSLLSSTVCPFGKDYDFNENVLELDFGFNYYRKYFYGFSHQNWFLVYDKTAIALSLRKDSKDLKKFRIILRTNHSLKTLKGFLNLNQLSQDFNLKHVFQLLFPVKKEIISGFRLGFDSKSDELLLKFDELLENNFYKIGILYSRDSQSTEEDFYNNKDISDPDFDHFLSLIGTKVRLKGYKGFRGGLDVTTDTTGLFTYATQFHSNEIVYHVMNELPFSPNNRQQLLRKRHIGNDIVTIVFQNKHFRGKPFNPQTIRSHFQHIFIIIRPHNNGYRIAVARHKDVPNFGPPLKSYYFEEELREFLLTKVINGENACHKCAKFKQMALRTRFEYLNDLFNNYSTQTTLVLNVNSNQQLIQFSQNFNKYFSQIFPKKSSKKESNNELIINERKNIFLENQLFFGAKLYEEDIEVLGSRLKCHSYQQNSDLSSVKILLNQNFLIILNEKRKKFVLNLRQILGFFIQNSNQNSKNSIEIQMKIYFHFGELLLLKEIIRLPVLNTLSSTEAIIEKNSILFELKSDLMTKIQFSDCALRSRQMKTIVLRRNSRSQDNSFGFHIQTKKLNFSQNNCVFVTEVNEHSIRVNDLKAGQRILELCSIPVISLTYEQILDFLKTSQTVSVALIQPLTDGTPLQNGCQQRNCQKSQEINENLRQNLNQQNDYENIQSVTQRTTTTATVYQSTTPTPKTPSYVSPSKAHNSRQQQTSPQQMTTHTQRPLHLKLQYNQNNNSSQSSTTSSTLQEDLIKLLTLNDCEIESNNKSTALESSNPPTDSHSSSRYSTATSTPYSSLERQRDDCVVTVAKPAFVVNSVNELGFGHKNLDVVNSNVEEEELEWPPIVSPDNQLKEQVKELSKEKLRLNETIRQLKEENQRLHFESQTASQQLRKFTEWFFSSNQNQ